MLIIICASNEMTYAFLRSTVSHMSTLPQKKWIPYINQIFFFLLDDFKWYSHLHDVIFRILIFFVGVIKAVESIFVFFLFDRRFALE